MRSDETVSQFAVSLDSPRTSELTRSSDRLQPERRHPKKAKAKASARRFHDKSIAKMVAQMLNAQVIGGKKGDRWRDDIWTMKYLSGFKWEMLSEQFGEPSWTWWSS
jgi:hypothetical protein